jgi:hypothetical protein
MDDPRIDPSFIEPPRRTSRIWLWIGGILGCLLCLTVLVISLPAAAVVGMVNQTSTASGPATQRAAIEERFASPPAGWKSIIDETFSSSRYGWDLTSREVHGAAVHAFVKDRQYIYNVNSLSNGGQTLIERPEDLMDVAPDEFFLTVEARQNNMMADGDGYGLVLRQVDGDSFVLFQLDNQGEACVLIYGSTDEQMDGLCGPYYYRSYKMNRLTVVTYQGSYHFLVDDRLIGSIDDLPIRKGKVGIFAHVSDSPDNFVFDNFKLYIPPD